MAPMRTGISSGAGAIGGALLLLVHLSGAGCATAPGRAEAGSGPGRESRFMVPPLFQYARWGGGGRFFYSLPLLSLDFRGTPADASRHSPWVLLPPILYMDYDVGVERQSHLLFPFGYTYRCTAEEESETALFPIWHDRRFRRWLRLGDGEYREIPGREWGVFPLFSVETEGEVTRSLTVWPLLLRYRREGRRKVLRLFFLIPIPLGEETLEEAIRSETPEIRWDAADEIGDRREIDLIPLLLEAMQSPDRVLRCRALRSLRRLTGESFGYRPDADPEAREEAIARARKWAE